VNSIHVMLDQHNHTTYQLSNSRANSHML